MNQIKDSKTSSRTGFKMWIFLLIAIVCSGFVFVRGYQWNILTSNYTVYADFQSVAGLGEGARIEIAGVKVGSVTRIFLTEDDYARVEMRLREGIGLPEDSYASIRTRGLLGNKIIDISRGGSATFVQPDGVLFDTEPAVDLEDIFGRLIYGKF